MRLSKQYHIVNIQAEDNKLLKFSIRKDEGAPEENKHDNNTMVKLKPKFSYNGGRLKLKKK